MHSHISISSASPRQSKARQGNKHNTREKNKKQPPLTRINTSLIPHKLRAHAKHPPLTETRQRIRHGPAPRTRLAARQVIPFRGPAQHAVMIREAPIQGRAGGFLVLALAGGALGGAGAAPRAEHRVPVVRVVGCPVAGESVPVLWLDWGEGVG